MSMKNMAAMFGTMAVLRRVDQEEPVVILYARVLYMAYLLISALIHAILHFRITSRCDETQIQIPVVAKPKSFREAVALEQEAEKEDEKKDEKKDEKEDENEHESEHEDEDGNSEPEPPKTETITVMEYDLRQLTKTRNNLVVNACILAAIHYKMGSVSPLVMAVATGIVRLMFDDPLVAIHFRGLPAVGALARPFKAAEGQFSALLKDLMPKEPPSARHQPAEDVHDDGEDDDDDDDSPTTINDMDDSDIKSDFVDDETKKDK